MRDKCKHPTCHCSERVGFDYCCESCETVVDTFEAVCHCGHSTCQPVQTLAPSAIHDYENVAHIAAAPAEIQLSYKELF